MEFSRFDQRDYRVASVVSGYGEWAETYDSVVHDEMDLRLLSRLTSIAWADTTGAIDLACGTGRVGSWLREHGVSCIDGLDLTPEMLDRARSREVYRELRHGDLRSAPLATASYDLATASLVDEHLPTLAPMYAEGSRVLRPGGHFIVVGYHPQFLMTVGMPTHFHRPDGEAVAIETHVHLLSDHTRAAHKHGLDLVELLEGLIDDEYIVAKPKWARYRSMPVSFAFAWRRRSV